MKKTTLLWLGIAILGLVLYMLPVLRHKSKETFSTGSSDADLMALSLSKTLEEQRTLAEKNALTAQVQQNQHLFEQFQTSVQSNSVDPLTGIQITPENRTLLNPTRYDEVAIRKLLPVMKRLNGHYTKNPTFTFSERLQNSAKQQLPELNTLIKKLETVLQNKAWGPNDTNVAMKVNTGDFLLGYSLLLNEYMQTDVSSATSALPAGLLPLTESDRITVEILKQTLDEIHQLSQKYKSHTFKHPVKTSVLLKKIPEMELKLSQVQKDGWDLSQKGKDFRNMITSGSFQKDYDMILEELKSTDANSTVQDMKDLWKNQTGKELPQEFESLKSSPASCKITQQYITSPSELQGRVSLQTKKTIPVPKYKCPDMRDYIHKSKIPNMTDYIRKDSIPCWACKL